MRLSSLRVAVCVSGWFHGLGHWGGNFAGLRSYLTWSVHSPSCKDDLYITERMYTTLELLRTMKWLHIEHRDRT